MNNDPDKLEELRDVNTSVWEQTNYWFGRYKHILKHMNYKHFHFMIYILCNEYNQEKINDKCYNAIRQN